MIEEFVEGYVKIILESEQDKECPRWGTYEVNVKEIDIQFHRKEVKRRVEKKIDTIMKKS